MSYLTNRERQEYAKKYRAALRQYRDRELAHTRVFPTFRARLQGIDREGNLSHNFSKVDC
jgi:hypothetical protein